MRACYCNHNFVFLNRTQIFDIFFLLPYEILHFPFYFSLFIHLKVLLQISYRSTNYLYRNRDFHFTSILDLDLLMAVLKAREFKICFLKSKCYVNSSWKVARKGRKGKLKVSVQTGFLCILHFTTMCQSYRI